MHRHKGHTEWSGGSLLETPMAQETSASLGMDVGGQLQLGPELSV